MTDPKTKAKNAKNKIMKKAMSSSSSSAMKDWPWPLCQWQVFIFIALLSLWSYLLLIYCLTNILCLCLCLISKFYFLNISLPRVPRRVRQARIACPGDALSNDYKFVYGCLVYKKFFNTDWSVKVSIENLIKPKLSLKLIAEIYKSPCLIFKTIFLKFLPTQGT